MQFCKCLSFARKPINNSVTLIYVKHREFKVFCCCFWYLNQSIPMKQIPWRFSESSIIQPWGLALEVMDEEQIIFMLDRWWCYYWKKPIDMDGNWYYQQICQEDIKLERLKALVGRTTVWMSIPGSFASMVFSIIINPNQITHLRINRLQIRTKYISNNACSLLLYLCKNSQELIVCSNARNCHFITLVQLTLFVRKYFAYVS